MQQQSLEIAYTQQPSAWILVDHDPSSLVYTYGLIIPNGALLRVDSMGYVKSSTALTFIEGESIQAWIRNNNKRTQGDNDVTN